MGRVGKYLAMLAMVAVLVPVLRAGDVPDSPAIGSAAPAFSLPGLQAPADAPPINLSQYKGKIVVLVWDSIHCPVAAAYHDRLNEFYQKYVAGADVAKKPQVVLLAIDSNVNEPADAVADFFKQNHLVYPVLKDEGSKVADAYGARVTPHVFVIDAEGKLQYAGAFDDSQRAGRVKRHYATDAVDALLAGKPVPTAQTKAFGCGVRRPE